MKPVLFPILAKVLIISNIIDSKMLNKSKNDIYPLVFKIEINYEIAT